MNVRSRVIAICGIAMIIFAVITTARVSADSLASQGDMSWSEASQGVDMESADQCLDLGLAPVETLDMADVDNQAEAYECPRGIPYCQRASQCADYCGPGGFEVCSQGCCACAG